MYQGKKNLTRSDFEQVRYEGDGGEGVLVRYFPLSSFI